MSNEVCERYAGALFSLAQESNRIEERKTDVEYLLNLLEENPEINTFFRAVKINRQEKKEFIDEVLGQVFDREMINFIKLLIDKGRISELKGILEQYIAQANQALGIQTAVVYSARELSESDRKKLQDALEKKHKCKIILENKIDPSVIAGIKVIVGNEVTDVTVKNRLDEMKGILLKGGLA
ncbi:MAG: F0F1 ATP synthase subunit delta [Solobacterium sp.]|nr:F0F1 ATP synthase subunit delta [Solobacterium sp.]